MIIVSIKKLNGQNKDELLNMLTWISNLDHLNDEKNGDDEIWASDLWTHSQHQHNAVKMISIFEKNTITKLCINHWIDQHKIKIQLFWMME